MSISRGKRAVAAIGAPREDRSRLESIEGRAFPVSESITQKGRESMSRSLAVAVRNLGVILVLLGAAGLSRADSPWDIEAVDADGMATNPKVGAAVDPVNKVAVEGIALNATADYLDPAQMWQTYVQAESPDQGGIVAFAAVFYDSSEWPRYPMDILPGDRVRVEGYAEFHNGKSNINERHSASPDLRFTVTKLASAVGLPAPQTLFDLSTCNGFDASRATGGERYESQWAELQNVIL